MGRTPRSKAPATDTKYGVKIEQTVSVETHIIATNALLIENPNCHFLASFVHIRVQGAAYGTPN